MCPEKRPASLRLFLFSFPPCTEPERLRHGHLAHLDLGAEVRNEHVAQHGVAGAARDPLGLEGLRQFGTIFEQLGTPALDVFLGHAEYLFHCRTDFCPSSALNDISNQAAYISKADVQEGELA